MVKYRAILTVVFVGERVYEGGIDVTENTLTENIMNAVNNVAGVTAEQVGSILIEEVND